MIDGRVGRVHLGLESVAVIIGTWDRLCVEMSTGKNREIKSGIFQAFCGGPGGGVERKTGGVDGIKLGYDDVIDVGNVYFLVNMV